MYVDRARPHRYLHSQDPLHETCALHRDLARQTLLSRRSHGLRVGHSRFGYYELGSIGPVHNRVFTNNHREHPGGETSIGLTRLALFRAMPPDPTNYSIISYRLRESPAKPVIQPFRQCQASPLPNPLAESTALRGGPGGAGAPDKSFTRTDGHNEGAELVRLLKQAAELPGAPEFKWHNHNRVAKKRGRAIFHTPDSPHQPCRQTVL